jgi:hypothetical protein
MENWNPGALTRVEIQKEDGTFEALWYVQLWEEAEF